MRTYEAFPARSSWLALTLCSPFEDELDEAFMVLSGLGLTYTGTGYGTTTWEEKFKALGTTPVGILFFKGVPNTEEAVDRIEGALKERCAVFAVTYYAQDDIPDEDPFVLAYSSSGNPALEDGSRLVALIRGQPGGTPVSSSKKLH